MQVRLIHYAFSVTLHKNFELAILLLAHQDQNLTECISNRTECCSFLASSPVPWNCTILLSTPFLCDDTKWNVSSIWYKQHHQITLHANICKIRCYKVILTYGRKCARIQNRVNLKLTLLYHMLSKGNIHISRFIIQP